MIYLVKKLRKIRPKQNRAQRFVTTFPNNLCRHSKTLIKASLVSGNNNIEREREKKEEKMREQSPQRQRRVRDEGI